MARLRLRFASCGNGPRDVDGERGEGGQDFRREVAPQEPALRLLEVLVGDEADATFGQGRQDLLGQRLAQALHHLVRALADQEELLPRPQPGRVRVRVSLVDGVLEGGHAHHEELVEVAGDDDRELQALEEGRGRVHRLLQDAAVELEPAQLAVEEELGLLLAGLGLALGHGHGRCLASRNTSFRPKTSVR
jgi:hypothetical protein